MSFHGARKCSSTPHIASLNFPGQTLEDGSQHGNPSVAMRSRGQKGSQRQSQQRREKPVGPQLNYSKVWGFGFVGRQGSGFAKNQTNATWK